MISVSSSNSCPNRLFATRNIVERARLRLPVNAAFRNEIVFKAVHQDYIGRLVEQFLALVVGDFAYGSETVYVMGGLLFDGMFGLHIQLLRHLVAVVGKR